MLRAIRSGLAVALLIFPGQVVSTQAHAQTNSSTREVGVKDGAGMFSKSAVGEANATLKQVLDKTKWQVAIETVNSLGGKSIGQATLANAKNYDVHGLYVLISKQDKRIGVEASNSAQGVFPKERRDALDKMFIDAMKAGKPDDGLRQIVAEVAKITNVNVAQRPAPKRLAPSDPAGVYDSAGMFGISAERAADQALKDLEKKHTWQAVVETVPSLGGREIRAVTEEHARAKEVRGLYVLIARDEKKFYVESSNSAKAVFDQPRRDAVLAALTDGFKKGDFDAGLEGAVKAIGDAMADSKATVAATKPAAPTTTPSQERPMLAGPGEPTKSVPPVVVEKPKAPVEKRSGPAPAPAPAPAPEAKASGGSKLPIILVLIVCAFIGFWLLRKMFGGARQVQQPTFMPTSGPRPQAPPGFGPAVGGQPMGAAPGPMMGGQPGYGPPPGYGPGYAPPPQGGGMGSFVKGALGGVAGAVVGNIIYDQFGRAHQHAQGAPLPPGFTTTPPQQATPHETFQADNVSTGGWDAPPAPPAPADEWGAGGGSEGGWGSAEPADNGGDWGSPDPNQGGGGDWGGGGGDDGGGGGDWGGGGDDGNAGGW